MPFICISWSGLVFWHQSSANSWHCSHLRFPLVMQGEPVISAEQTSLRWRPCKRTCTPCWVTPNHRLPRPGSPANKRGAPMILQMPIFVTRRPITRYATIAVQVLIRFRSLIAWCVEQMGGAHPLRAASFASIDLHVEVANDVSPAAKALYNQQELQQLAATIGGQWSHSPRCLFYPSTSVHKFNEWRTQGK